MKPYVVSIHLNCIDAIQIGAHNILLYKEEEVDKKYTGYNLKTIGLLYCVLTGVCVEIRAQFKANDVVS